MTTNETFPTVTGWGKVISIHQKTTYNEADYLSRKGQPAQIRNKHFLGANERVMISAAKQGNVEAFNQLVLSYQDKVFTQAYYILGDRMAAEDAAQEAFVSAYESIKSYRGGSFRGWLFRIVTNKCLDDLRDSKRYLETDFEDNDEWLSGIDMPSWPDNSGKTPEDYIISTEIERYLCMCLNRLITNYRIAIILVDIFDMSYGEAAKIIGCPVGTIKSRLSRARFQMRYFLRGLPGVACL
jgi:RNA polymerase sigma-70 factor (ECF subfamily)